MTALEFLNEYIEEHHLGFIPKRETDIANLMIGFAKYHVEQALLKVANSDMDAICSWSGNPYTSEGSDSIDFDKVMKIYPLENIK